MSGTKVQLRTLTVDGVAHLPFGPVELLRQLVDLPGTDALLAVATGAVVGVAAAYETAVHRTRRRLIVDVAPDHRRRGIGTALVQALRTTDPRPLAGGVDEGSPAHGLAAALGARPYQTCPPLHLTHGAWERVCAEPLPRVVSGTVITSVAASGATAADLFVERYRWQHADWAPMAADERALTALRRSAAEADPELSSAAVRDGRVLAACLAYPADDPVVLEGETQVRDQPGGVALLQAVLRRSLDALRGTATELMFDGHESDPHFAPLVPWLGLSGPRYLLCELSAG